MGVVPITLILLVNTQRSSPIRPQTVQHFLVSVGLVSLTVGPCVLPQPVNHCLFNFRWKVDMVFSLVALFPGLDEVIVGGVTVSRHCITALGIFVYVTLRCWRLLHGWFGRLGRLGRLLLTAALLFLPFADMRYLMMATCLPRGLQCLCSFCSSDVSVGICFFLCLCLPSPHLFFFSPISTSCS